MLSHQQIWRFYTPIAVNFISPPIDADTLSDFFRPPDCGDVAVLKSCDKIAQPDGLALLAICSNDRRKIAGTSTLGESWQI